jgi:protein-L-isoaspartate O-methyltransferase
MVAIMLERLRVAPGMKVAEFGSGSGYHLACALELSRPGGRAIGIDVGEPERRAARDSALRLVVGDMAKPPLRPGSVDAVYSTCYATDVLEPLSRAVRPGGVLQVIAPIEATEFAAEPAHSWLAGRYQSYDEYLAPRRQSYASIREYRKSGEGALVQLGVLYDVSFVPARRSADESLGIRIPDFGL